MTATACVEPPTDHRVGDLRYGDAVKPMNFTFDDLNGAKRLMLEDGPVAVCEEAVGSGRPVREVDETGRPEPDLSLPRNVGL